MKPLTMIPRNRAIASQTVALLTEARELERQAESLLRTELLTIRIPQRQDRQGAIADAMATMPRPPREAMRLLHVARDLCWRAVVMNDGLAQAAARRWTSNRECDDEVQLARDGLFEAAKRFDPARGVLFSTHAQWWVRARLSRYAGGPRVKPFWRERIRLLCIAEAEGLDHHEICHRMGITADTLVRIRIMARESSPVSIETEVGGMALQIATPCEDTAAAIDVEVLMGHVSALPTKERDIITRRYGLEGKTPETFAQIGKRHHISRERARQIERKTMDWLRSQIADVVAA